MKTNGTVENGGGGGTAGVSIAPVGKEGRREKNPLAN